MRGLIGCPEAHKRLLQTAAVLGREFAPRLAAGDVGRAQRPLESLLLELKRLEFLYERPGTRNPVYVFKHALTQEVAYDSLLTTRRQMLHAAAGHAMERLYPDWLAEHYEELAHHFTLGAVWEKAFDYLTKSGDKARQAYANQEAIAFYTQALEVSQRITPAVDDAQLLPVYEGRGRVWMLLTKYDEAIADFQQMRQMARAVGQSAQRRGKSLSSGVCPLGEVLRRAHCPLSNSTPRRRMQLSQHTGDHKILARSLTSLGSVRPSAGAICRKQIRNWRNPCRSVVGRATKTALAHNLRG